MHFGVFAKTPKGVAELLVWPIVPLAELVVDLAELVVHSDCCKAPIKFADYMGPACIRFGRGAARP